MSTKTKRILSGTAAVVIALALLLGGVFAYTLFEHKSNVLTSDPNYQGRLVEDFEKNPEWNVDEEIKKEISVKNMGGTEQFPGSNWGDIYVRVQLKEHMDITPIGYVYYPEANETTKTRFMIDKSGNFVRFPATGDIASQLSEIKSDSAWTSVISDAAKRDAFTSALQESDFVKVKGYYDETEYWYVVTKEGDPNGQYGAFLVVDKTADESKRVNITDSERATDVDYSSGAAKYNPGDHETEECLYPVHYWGERDAALCDMDTHNYVEWNLGDSVIMIADWDRKPVDKWILDPATGWATWGNALKPGQSTDLLMESIKPIAQPDGQMFYVIHAELEATDMLEMGDDWIIKGIFGIETTRPETTVPEITVPEVTVPETTEPTTEPETDNELEINTGGSDYDSEKGFETQNNDTNDDFDFGVYVLVNYMLEADLVHGASIPLEKVLKDADSYEGIEITALDGRFADYFEIKNDPRNGNKPSLFFNWFPADRTIMDSVESWNGPITFGRFENGASIPTITTQVVLAQGEKESKPFNVTFYYTNSIFAY